nr:winged helix-turn-helix domain-containing protein [uncultured Friedmanniella sp.]
MRPSGAVPFRSPEHLAGDRATSPPRRTGSAGSSGRDGLRSTRSRGAAGDRSGRGRGWGPAHERETNYLRVYLGQVRRKVKAEPGQPRHFVTEPGVGYRFVP